MDFLGVAYLFLFYGELGIGSLDRLPVGCEKERKGSPPEGGLKEIQNVPKVKHGNDKLVRMS